MMWKSIIRTFRQRSHFWHYLVVWGVIFVHLVNHGTTLKTACSLGGLFFFFFFFLIIHSFNLAWVLSSIFAHKIEKPVSNRGEKKVIRLVVIVYNR